MIGKPVVGFAAALAFAVTGSVAGAGPGAAGGSVGGMSAMSFGAGNLTALGASAAAGIAKAGTVNESVNVPPGSTSALHLLFPNDQPEHYFEIKLIGRIAPNESGLKPDQQVVRLGLDGQTILMSIDGDATSNSLQFDRGDEVGQNLYRTIVSRRLVVVGDQKLRNQIMMAAANPANSKTISVDGFVHDRVTPYLVLVSVGEAP